MSDIFISYKREERGKAKAIASVLTMRGYSVWWDVDLLPGDRFADEIKNVIHNAHAAIVLWSRSAIVSDFVRAEASMALNRNILVPVQIEDCDPPLPFNTYHTLDLNDWNGEVDSPLLVPLVSAIEKKIGVKQHTPSATDVANILDQPKGEVEYWKSISNQEPQSAKEYEAYILKYGERSIFYDLAKIRIEKLSETKDIASKRNLTHITGNAAFIATVIGVMIAGATLYYSLNSPTNIAEKEEYISNSVEFSKPKEASSDSKIPEKTIVRHSPTVEELKKEQKEREAAFINTCSMWKMRWITNVHEYGIPIGKSYLEKNGVEEKVIDKISGIGVHTPLAKAVLYDAATNLGTRAWRMADKIIEKDGLPINIDKEKSWIKEYVRIWRDFYESKDFPINRAVFRNKTFESLIDNSNWDLEPPFDVGKHKFTAELSGCEQ